MPLVSLGGLRTYLSAKTCITLIYLLVPWQNTHSTKAHLSNMYLFFFFPGEWLQCKWACQVVHRPLHWTLYICTGSRSSLAGMKQKKKKENAARLPTLSVFSLFICLILYIGQWEYVQLCENNCCVLDFSGRYGKRVIDMCIPVQVHRTPGAGSAWNTARVNQFTTHLKRCAVC